MTHAKEITSERLADAIELVRIGAGRDGYRNYPGGGGIWCGQNNAIADGNFADWGLARAVTIILNAALDGSLVTRPDGMTHSSAPKRGWRSDCPKCVASKFTCDEHFSERGGAAS